MVFLVLAVVDLVDFGPGVEVTGEFLTAAGAFFGGALILPSAIYAFLRLIGRKTKPVLNSRWWGLAILVVPVVILIGHLVSGNDWLMIGVLPTMHVLAIGIPVIALIAIVQWNLPAASPQRNWGGLAAGLVLGPFMILILEIITLVAVILVVGVYLQQDPATFSQLITLSERYSQGLLGMDEIAEQATIMLSDPFILIALLVFGSVLVPLIEELFKPVAVWLLIGRPLSPNDGFILGVISGAGYAIFENLALSANSGADWAIVTIARLGTTLLHSVTAGMVGYGIVMTFRHRKYLRWPLMYIIAVLMHGAWNASVISGSVAAFIPVEEIPPIINWAAGITDITLITLSVLSLCLLIAMNVFIRRAIMSPAPAGAEKMLINNEL